MVSSAGSNETRDMDLIHPVLRSAGTIDGLLEILGTHMAA